MSALEPISSTAFSALIWELENNAEAVFGPAPYAASVPPGIGRQAGKRLLRVLTLLRTKIVPSVLASLNQTEVTFVRRTAVVDNNDPLAVRNVTATENAFAYIHGPSDEDLERGNVSVADYQVVVGSHSLTGPMTERDAVRIGGVDHDIVKIIPYPAHPQPVAYRFMVKRAA